MPTPATTELNVPATPAAPVSNGSPTANTATPATPKPTSGSVLGSVANATHDWLPEKLRVMKEDGVLDLDASARKVAEAYSVLEKRFGSGDAPPKSPDEYEFSDLPEKINIDEMKKDPRMQSFLKGAHAKGMTNAQVSYVLNDYLSSIGEMAEVHQAQRAEDTEKELRTTWATDKDYETNLKDAYRAFKLFADPDDLARIDDIGNSAVAVRILAKIGKQIAEDVPPEDDQSGGTGAGSFQEQVNALRADPAYANALHPQHGDVMRKIDALYAKRFGTQSAGPVAPTLKRSA